VLTVLIATDADWVADEVDATLADPDATLVRVRAGADVLDAVHAHDPDLVILDLQIGNMGGIATCLQLQLEEGAGRLDVGPILLLLDRPADVFLARRCDADGWLIKPLDSLRLRRAVDAVMAGDRWVEGETTATPA
jgi:DNA-binding NarL/FixJ family response regulator